MDAVVLAGGAGTRLRSRVSDVPKPMAPVRGRPFLEFVLDRLEEQGVTMVVLSIGHLGHVITRHFGTSYRSMGLAYSVEDSPLGTGGAIRHALPLVGDRPFLVLNGDTVVPTDVEALVRARARSGRDLVMTVCRVPDVARFGALGAHGGAVHEIREKGETGPGLINCGAYLVGAGVRAALSGLSGPFSFETRVLTPWIAAHGAAYVESPGPFLDIGVPHDYDRADLILNP